MLLGLCKLCNCTFWWISSNKVNCEAWKSHWFSKWDFKGQNVPLLPTCILLTNAPPKKATMNCWNYLYLKYSHQYIKFIYKDCLFNWKIGTTHELMNSYFTHITLQMGFTLSSKQPLNTWNQRWCNDLNS